MNESTPNNMGSLKDWSQFFLDQQRGLAKGVPPLFTNIQKRIDALEERITQLESEQTSVLTCISNILNSPTTEAITTVKELVGLLLNKDDGDDTTNCNTHG